MGEVLCALLPAADPHTWALLVSLWDLDIDKAGQDCAVVPVAAHFAMLGAWLQGFIG